MLGALLILAILCGLPAHTDVRVWAVSDGVRVDIGRKRHGVR